MNFEVEIIYCNFKNSELESITFALSQYLKLKSKTTKQEFKVFCESNRNELNFIEKASALVYNFDFYQGLKNDIKFNIEDDNEN